MKGLIKGHMCKGQAWSVVWGILFLVLAAHPGEAEQAPVPQPKPASEGAVEPDEEEAAPAASPVRKRKPSTGGRKSGATFYEIDGEVPVTWSGTEIAAARAACVPFLEGLDIAFKPVDAVGGPEGCGAAAPIEVRKIVGVAIRPPATLNCKFTGVLHKWARGALQQAAKAALNDKIVSINNVASYTCRKRRGDGSKRLSEHALTNALDIAAFRLKSGGTVSVSDDWGPMAANTDNRSSDDGDEEEALSPKATFLRYVHESACEIFSTVLGPDHNALHKDHFHFDHGRGGRYGLCH
ncbi:MAG: extensin family protein [Alphaproteobacteria bacterium]|nr:extensin family protein [Alphaproteobacteria bacterium]